MLALSRVINKLIERFVALTIGKTRGTHLSKFFDQDPNFNIIELNNYGQAKMTKFGRINAIAASALALS